MLKFACIKVGIPQGNKSSQANFYSKVKFNIGGHIFSFLEWEHGILRGNRKAPNALTPPFRKNDARIHWVVKNPDIRIHFSLNYARKSSPSVRLLSAESLEDDLAIMAAAFFEDECNFFIDPSKRELHVSSILSWNLSDFVERTTEIPDVLMQFVTSIRKQNLDRLLSQDKNPKVVFLPYDWIPVVKNALLFDPENVKSTLKLMQSSRNKQPPATRGMSRTYSEVARSTEFSKIRSKSPKRDSSPKSCERSCGSGDSRSCGSTERSCGDKVRVVVRTFSEAEC
eukprot:Plantae.Rhodophyta-Palmaria_palmata.ctg17424.p1 GENE.Plantae.Rhodophyta-Palmaria_palmata.ctg17424~~Plantae.Rhodophyta-Palmaria_palmata.ctg17424.p1  ORF type:complete len:283 (+),score=37.00 Plantae.Rhodophyta-Palmaria_palmata.ctg17424:126-974(+)